MRCVLLYGHGRRRVARESVGAAASPNAATLGCDGPDECLSVFQTEQSFSNISCSQITGLDQFAIVFLHKQAVLILGRTYATATWKGGGSSSTNCWVVIKSAGKIVSKHAGKSKHLSLM